MASVEPYAKNLADNHTNISSLIFYEPGALPDAQPTVSEHQRQLTIEEIIDIVKTAKKNSTLHQQRL